MKKISTKISPVIIERFTMKKSLFVVLLSLSVSACVSMNNPASDTSSVDKVLQDSQPIGNAHLTNDIATKTNKSTVQDKAVENIPITNDEVTLRQEQAAQPNQPQVTQLPMNTQTQSDQLKIEDITAGTGQEAQDGMAVTVHYTGWLTNGQKFDSSKDRNQPFTFNLGAGQVIQGWDMGVKGMKVGGKRKLTIPAQLGYGDRGAGGIIPPGATLVFEVELLGVK